MLLAAFSISKVLSTLAVVSMYFTFASLFPMRVAWYTLVPKLSPHINGIYFQATECWKGPGNKASLAHSVSLCINVD